MKSLKPKSTLIKINLKNLTPINYYHSQEPVHKITIHTTLIRDQLGQGLGFSIAGGKGSPSFKDDCEGIFISRLTDGGLAQKDNKMRVGDMILSVSSFTGSRFKFVLTFQYPIR